MRGALPPSFPVRQRRPLLLLLPVLVLLPRVYVPAAATAPSPVPATPQTPGACPHGTLDARYCDRDGDLLADPPSDPKAFVRPETLIFAYTPVEDPAVYREVWKEFLAHLEKTTGRRVQFFPVQSNAAQIEALRAGRLHVAGFNTGSVPFAVNAAGFVPFAVMERKDGKTGYEMEILVRADSPINTPKDLRGRTIAFTSPTSNSGYKAPALLLKESFGLQEGRDYKSAFSGKHDNSILGVLHRDYEAAAVANSVLHQMIRRGVVKASDFRTIYRSETFPTTAYGLAHDLDPALAKAIRDAFFSFPWAGSGLQREFGETEGVRFVPVRYKDAWAEVRRIDAASGVSYGSARP